jgi:hypothetical protein
VVQVSLSAEAGVGVPPSLGTVPHHRDRRLVFVAALAQSHFHRRRRRTPSASSPLESPGPHAGRVPGDVEHHSSTALC